MGNRLVIIAPYDPDWPRIAAERATQLQVLGPVLVTVHHIGSTSVPGLGAKSVIDLIPVVTALEELDLRQADIEALGYCWRGELGIAGRRYCSLDDENGVRKVQLHFFETGSPEIERHVAFRDYLRAHPDTSRAYEIEKRRARDLHPNDTLAYTDEKDAWIRKTEKMALVWMAAREC
jgi:GrpB-like predicted nucleotidyltransferase (UPF0157 family)